MDNLTPFAATCMPFMTPRNLESALIIVAGRFDLPPPGAGTAAKICEQQSLPPLEDVHYADPEHSSLKREGLASCPRSGTDILVYGDAWTPGGRPAAQALVEVRVGPCRRAAVVYGDRWWRRGFGGPRPSAPRSFERAPLVYERSFGGFLAGARGARREACERNPVGLGLMPSLTAAVDRALPNIEDPQQLIQTPSDLPSPVGFGPIARSWGPRRAFAGTYDDAWTAERAPLWPDDLDERFFRAAPPELRATKHLEGNEQLRLTGLHPGGVIELPLPHQRLLAKLRTATQTLRLPLPLDTVIIDATEMTLTMIWRAQVILRPSFLILEEILVRSLRDRSTA
ncbi:DUF2169 domain-containing protein [Pseudenhygromyxa sp. WMMC2535]|uniref:DUF2169 family type VI secretion system accessory protein n=1 Tax=Pseudenhygromyxa sp. WMMC2535 TaxID=2712867 RepID=UPI001553A467|nr:DUF2169 domain-containing protein [Pseudenhygromyxa sp. WMMC2535]NVB38658.1 DUF2169 domain-containing protein [Pseudenhygromyxa sp. WMMC2535]